MLRNKDFLLGKKDGLSANAIIYVAEYAEIYVPMNGVLSTE